MSRIGNKPIFLMKEVVASINGQFVGISGPKGKLERELHSCIKVDQTGNQLILTRKDDSRRSKALHGLSRTLIGNMILGVTIGFQCELHITGVGYKAEAKEQKLHLNLGYSHSIIFNLPSEVQVFTDSNKTVIKLASIDNQVLGEVAAKIRSFKPPEPYKGKGIRYFNEVIKRKEGKAAGK